MRITHGLNPLTAVCEGGAVPHTATKLVNIKIVLDGLVCSTFGTFTQFRKAIESFTSLPVRKEPIRFIACSPGVS